ncbi:unnamed protein product [Clonostachys byssicola]|uniref:CHAT domain-containing protein n=1 Tax=Clonostachys byssicola TaxID=160290 RepID=A0A9N9UUB5_9HYPO|nr:unnamed protein product [Clonostachys byssicola]
MSKPDYPSRYTLLYDAGEGYFWKYKISNRDDDLNTTLKYYREAFKLQWISPLSLFDVGYKLANAYAKVEKWRESYETFVQMLVLAPHLFHRSAEYSDKQRLIFTVSGVASMAAAAIRVEEPIYRVISLLELGRGIITQPMQDMRHDLSQVKESHPELAQEYTELTGRLSKQILSGPKDIKGRYEMAERLDAVIGEINTILGISPYAFFCEEKFMKMAEHGPVIVLNLAVDRCDAIIPEKSRLHNLHLPDFRSTDAFQMAQKKVRDYELLEWMWTTTTRPILDALGNCDISHFAGHGRTETCDLIRGAILLQDWRERPLIVGDLYKADISGSQPLLAYLSACGTREVAQYHLQDETIHLMSSFQFAGFPHVIGTLWQVNDETCVHMSVGVYRRILDHGMRSSSVSEALHHASRSSERIG